MWPRLCRSLHSRVNSSPNLGRYWDRERQSDVLMLLKAQESDAGRASFRGHEVGADPTGG
jgi:hypothetical protein